MAANIDEIEDVSDMYEMMTALGISSKGLKTVDEMKARVREEFNPSTLDKPNWTAGQAFSVLSDAKDEDERKRQILLDFFSESEQFLDELDKHFVQLLQPQQNIVDIGATIKTRQEQLKQKEYFVLVAGETGSGKSSLINLILGEELLPYSVLSTTSTICELKYDKERRVVAHFKDKDPETGLSTKDFRLEEPPEGSSEQSYLEQISPFVHVRNLREKGSIFKKIEIFWPHQLLKRGVVIIDSPGVGESEIMDEIVRQYLPEAFAFIYVINSANSGGVQKDRLEKLLEDVNQVTLERQELFPSKCALFVCNKWDQVPKKEIEEVKTYVTRRLKKYWAGLDPELQIISMSTKNANTAQRYGIITGEFSTLMNGMRSMVLKSMEARLEVHWKWLDYILSRVIYQAEAFVKNVSRDHGNAVSRLGEIHSRLEAIEEQQSAFKKELRDYMETHTTKAAKALTEYLTSDAVRGRFTSWTLDEVPKAESSWEETNKNIRKALDERMKEIVEHWEEDNKVIANTRESLLQHFEQKYCFVEGQLRNLQGAVTADDISLQESHPLDGSFTVALGAVTSPIWVPLGLVAMVIAAPLVGVMTIKDKLEGSKRLKIYKSDKCKTMAEISTDHLNTAKDKKVIALFMDNQLKDAALCLKQIEARLPDLIKADRLLCEELMEKERSQKKKQELYQPVAGKGFNIKGRLAVFGLEEIRAADIKSDNLDWNEDTSLGCGAFATVYQGQMRNGVEQTVALKVCNKALDVENASLILEKAELLRKLNHPHIVTFYGTSLFRKMDKVKMILVMEKCKGSLKSYISDHPEAVPAKSVNQTAKREACRWAKEITEALVFIHAKGIVHRDLKLENILLSEDNSVKVTDVGVYKEAKGNTGTLVGNPVYIAPEVFHSKIFDSRADIYSFGLILWEMWYGQQAFSKVMPETLEAFYSLIDGGCRPEDVDGCERPPKSWKELMEKCWNGYPDKRPSAENCNRELTELYEQVVQHM